MDTRCRFRNGQFRCLTFFLKAVMLFRISDLFHRRLATYRAREIPLRRASMKISAFESEQSTAENFAQKFWEAKKKNSSTLRA